MRVHLALMLCAAMVVSAAASAAAAPIDPGLIVQTPAMTPTTRAIAPTLATDRLTPTKLAPSELGDRPADGTLSCTRKAVHQDRRADSLNLTLVAGRG